MIKCEENTISNGRCSFYARPLQKVAFIYSTAIRRKAEKKNRSTTLSVAVSPCECVCASYSEPNESVVN